MNSERVYYTLGKQSRTLFHNATKSECDLMKLGEKYAENARVSCEKKNSCIYEFYDKFVNIKYTGHIIPVEFSQVVWPFGIIK